MLLTAPQEVFFDGDLGERILETHVRETLSHILESCMKGYSGNKDHARDPT